MKLGSQIVPPAVDPNDAGNRLLVERLGGRGAPDFIHAKLSTADLNKVATNPINFDTVVSSRGLSVDGSGRFSLLKAGRTYLLKSASYISNTTASGLDYQWYDVTGAAVIGTEAEAATVTNTGHDSAQPETTAIFVPTVDSEVEVRVNAATTGVDVNASFSYAQIIEINGPAIAGPLEFIESVELSSPAQDVTFSGLNGDEDEIYIIEYDAIANSTGYVAELYPNGSAPAASTADSQRHSVDNGAAVFGEAADTLRFASTGFTTAQQRESGHLTFYAKTGAHRLMRAESISSVSATRVLGNQWTANWTDTATNITSLQLHASVASAFNTGSVFSLYRLRRQSFPENSWPPGHAEGCAMVYNSASTVDIAPGTVKDSTDKRDITVSSTLTADITVSGANGLDTGSEASSTWYALYVIDGLGVAPASLLSTNFTSPTLPSGYDVFRRVGAVRNNGSSNILEFTFWEAAGRLRRYSYDSAVSPTLLSGQTVSVVVSAATAAPPSAVGIRIQWDYSTSFGGNGLTLYQGTGTGDPWVFRHAANASGSFIRGTGDIPVDSSQQFYYQENGSDVVLTINCLGYTEEI